MSLVAYGESSSDSEVEDGGGPQDEKKSDVRKLLGLLPPPKGSKSSNKQPVRISLPTLKPGNSASDDEEEEVSPQVKRVKMQGGASRLTALLPQPKAAPKQLGAGRVSSATTRSMVPYTLSKRRQETIKSEKIKSMKTKSRGKSQASGGDGSDSDEEPVSFFSHLEETVLSVTDATVATSSSVVAPLTVLPIPLDSVSSPGVSSAGDVHRSHVDSCGTQYSSPTSSYSLHISPNVAPSQSNSVQEQREQTGNHTTQYSWSQYTTNCAPALSPPHTHSVALQEDTEQGTTATGCGGDDGTESESGAGGVSSEGEGGGRGEVLGGAGPGITIDQEALRRLAGGNTKRRGREDALNNIMDILGDDVMEDARTYQRHYGEDPTITKLYKADKSKLKTPTGQQKRKHQITWLAHEAKERELELQKQWAAGSQNRRDSRFKYGF